jgi:hypothetical protein
MLIKSWNKSKKNKTKSLNSLNMYNSNVCSNITCSQKDDQSHQFIISECNDNINLEKDCNSTLKTRTLNITRKINKIARAVSKSASCKELLSSNRSYKTEKGKVLSFERMREFIEDDYGHDFTGPLHGAFRPQPIPNILERKSVPSTAAISPSESFRRRLAVARTQWHSEDL